MVGFICHCVGWHFGVSLGNNGTKLLHLLPRRPLHVPSNNVQVLRLRFTSELNPTWGPSNLSVHQGHGIRNPPLLTGPETCSSERTQRYYQGHFEPVVGQQRNIRRHSIMSKDTSANAPPMNQRSNATKSPFNGTR